MGQALLKQKTQAFPPLLDETQIFSLWSIADVRELRKRFTMQVNGFAIVEAQFESIMSFKKDMGKYNSLEDLFEILDNDHDGRLDGLELLGGLALCCHATFEEKAQFCFELFDFNMNSTLSKKELIMMMIGSICGMNLLTGGDETAEPSIEAFEMMADDAFLRADRDGDDQISYAEFVLWARSNRELMTALEALNKASLEARLNINPDDSAEETDDDYLSDGDLAHISPQLKAKDKFRGFNDEFGRARFLEIDAPWRNNICEPTLFRARHTLGHGPDTNLELRWALGYRSRHTRNNLRFVFNDSDSKDTPSLITYPTAALGIVYDIKNSVQRFYQGHYHEITCLAMHPSDQIVATGDSCGQVHIWNALTMQCIRVIELLVPHGVEFLAFSPSGDRIATVSCDSEHTLALYDTSNGEIISSSKGLPNPHLVFGIAYARDGSELVLVGQKNVKFFTSVQTSQRAISSVSGRIGKIGKKQTFFSVTYTEKDAVVGCASGELYRFKNHQCVQVVQAHGTREPILSIYYSMLDAVLVTGSRDGTVKTWDSALMEVGMALDLSEDLDGDGRADSDVIDSSVSSVQIVGKRILVGSRSSDVFVAMIPVNPGEPCALNRIAYGHCGSAITSVAAHPSRDEFSTVGTDRTLRVWSLRTMTQLCYRNLPQYANAVSYNSLGHILCVGMEDGTIALMDTNHPKLRVYSTWKHCTKPINAVKFSPNGIYMAVASADSNIYLYTSEDQKQFRRLAVCKGHTAAVEHIDFSSDSMYLQSNGADRALLFWNMYGNEVKTPRLLRDLKWATFSCIFGWSVQGIWPRDCEYTEFKSLYALPDLGVVVTGGCNQQVNLYRYPSLTNGALYQSYIGHAGIVTGVHFSYNRRHLISIGSTDNTILIWKHEVEQDEASDDELGSVSSASASVISGGSSIAGGQELIAQAIIPGPSTENGLEGAGDDSDLETTFEDHHMNGGNVHPWKTASVEPTIHFHNEESTDCDLVLRWVHGYRAHDCRNNLFYSAEGNIVYHSARVGIVYGKSVGKQRFLVGAHSDDIISIAVHPSGQYFASSDRSSKPTIVVWDAVDTTVKRRIFGMHVGGIPLLAFNTRGNYLASMSQDENNTLYIHDWTNGAEIMQTPVSKRKVNCICFLHLDSHASSDESRDVLITAGNKSIKFWRFNGQNANSQNGLWGKEKRRNVLCVASGTPNICVSCDGDGTILVWQNHKVVSNARTDVADRNRYRETVHGKEKYPHDSKINAIWAIPGPLLAVEDIHDSYILSAELESCARYITGDNAGTIAVWVMVLGYGEDKSTTDKPSTVLTKLPHLICIRQFNSAQFGAFTNPSPIRALCFRDGMVLVGLMCSQIVEVREKSVGVCYPLIQDSKAKPGSKGLPSVGGGGRVLTVSTPDTGREMVVSGKDSQVFGSTFAPNEVEAKEAADRAAISAFVDGLANNLKCEILISSHSDGELWALATHPKEAKYFTGGDDTSLRCWNLNEHELISYCIVPNKKIPGKCRAIDISPIDGDHIAVAMSTGSCYVVLTAGFLVDRKRGQCARELVLEEGKDIFELEIGHGKSSSIKCVKYSFEGSYLIASTFDGNLLVYVITNLPGSVGGPTSKKYILSSIVPVASYGCISHLDFGVKLSVSINAEIPKLKRQGTLSNLIRKTVTTVSESFNPETLKIMTTVSVDEYDVDEKMGKSVLVDHQKKGTTRDLDLLADICIQTASVSTKELKFWCMDQLLSSSSKLPATKDSVPAVPSGGATPEPVVIENPVSMSPSLVKDAWWASWSLPYGWPVQGIWPAVEDGTIINGVARAHSWDTVPVLASVDDYGRVKLFNYPSVSAGSPDKCYRGHSRHVTSIRFSYDDSYCVTVGGQDRSIFVWETDIKDELRERHAAGEDSAKDAIAMDAETFAGGSLEEIYDNFARFSSQETSGIQQDFNSKSKPWRNVIREPSDWQDDDSLVLPPAECLELKYVHGYRSWDCTNNIGYGENVSNVVYHVAGVGIVLNKDTGLQIHNLDHDGEISCLNVHIAGHLIVTGDQCAKPKLVVWDANTGVAVSVIYFHSKGVSHVCFSQSGDLVVSVGMDTDRKVAVHNVRTKALVGYGTAGSNADVYALAVCGDDSFLTAGKQHITFWTLPSPQHPGGPLQSKNGLFKHTGISKKTVTSATYFGHDAITGMRDGHVILWKDRSSNRCALKHAPDSAVTAICSTTSRIISGGQDGKIIMWNSQLVATATIDMNATTPVPVTKPKIQALACKDDRLLIGTRASEIYEISILNPTQDTYRLVEGHFANPLSSRPAAMSRDISAHPSLGRFVTCGDDSTIRVWDLKRNERVKQNGMVTMASAVTALSFDTAGTSIAVACAGGAIRLLLATSLEDSLGEVSTSTYQVKVLKFSPDDATLAAGTVTGMIYLIDVKTFSCRSQCVGHSGSILGIDFTIDSLHIQSCSAEYELFFWNSSDGQKLDRASQARDLVWHSQTCVVGWSVQGCWAVDPLLGFEPELTTVDRSPNGKLLCACDAMNRLRLYQHPCPTDDSACHVYKAHSSAISSVRFTSDGKNIITAGGLDKAVIRWAIHKR